MKKFAHGWERMVSGVTESVTFERFYRDVMKDNISGMMSMLECVLKLMSYIRITYTNLLPVEWVYLQYEASSAQHSIVTINQPKITGDLTLPDIFTGQFDQRIRLPINTSRRGKTAFLRNAK